MFEAVIQRVLDQVITDPSKGRKVTSHFQCGFALNGNMTMLLVQAVTLRDDNLMQCFGHIKALGCWPLCVMAIC